MKTRAKRTVDADKLTTTDGGGMEVEDSGGLMKQEPVEDFGEEDDDSEERDLNFHIKMEEESDSDDQFDDDNFSQSWNSSSDGEGGIASKSTKKTCAEKEKKVGTKRKMPAPSKKPRGRPKQPRRLTDGTSSEEEDGETKCSPVPGFGYPLEFKMKVLKYAETHSNSATAEKFGIRPKRVRDWKGSRHRIEERIVTNQRPRSDGFTVEEKLKAVAFATERSIDEARILYNVDRHTIGKWKSKKEQLEARVLLGEGSSKRLPGCGSKPKYTQIEKALRDWIVALRMKDIAVNSRMILDKANSLVKDDPSMEGVSGPKTWNWVHGFLKRQNLQGSVGSSNNEDTLELMESKANIAEDADNSFDGQVNSKECQSDDPVKKKTDEMESSANSNSNEDSTSEWCEDLSSDQEEEEETKGESKKSKKTRAKRKVSPKPKRSVGRPKQHRRSNVPDDYTSEEDEMDDEINSEFKLGFGYPVEFKMKVLKYAETHTGSATAEKFGLRPKLIGEWIKYKSQIEEKHKGGLKRAPKRSFTIEEKLQTIAFASERSMGEAELLYSVDKSTIRKWKKQKEELEAMLSQGQGKSLKQKGGGCKLKYSVIEEDLREWIVALRLRNVTLNHKMILNKAKSLLEQNPCTSGSAHPKSAEWVVKFLRRHSLHGLLGNTFGREDPREVLEVELKTSDNVGKNFDKFVEIPENPNKRNRKTISLEDRVNIIRRIERGETQGQVAKSLKMPTSTVQTIWSSRNELLHKYANPKLKTKSDALVWKAYSVIGAALQDWMEQRVSKSLNINSSNLLERAIQLSETYKLPEFNLEAKQWVRVFCKKHKLSDVLDELKGANDNTSSFLPKAPLPENTDSNSMDSGDHHDNDDLHSNYNDFPAVNHNCPQPSMLPSHFSSFEMLSQAHNSNNLTENLNLKRLSSFSSSNNNTDKHPVISHTEAVKCYSLLRTWIHANYGQHEDILNSQLALVENSMLKNRFDSNKKL